MTWKRKELLPGIASCCPLPRYQDGGGACCRYNPLPSPSPRHHHGQAVGYIGSRLRRRLPQQPPPCRGLRAPGSRAPAGYNCGQQFLLHVEVQSVLQIYVEVEEPVTSENPTQSFEIHYIFRRRTQLLAVIIYST